MEEDAGKRAGAQERPIRNTAPRSTHVGGRDNLEVLEQLGEDACHRGLARPRIAWRVVCGGRCHFKRQEIQ